MPDLVRAIDRLKERQRIQIIWLTPADNIPDALPPEQENLVAAIWSAIDLPKSKTALN